MAYLVNKTDGSLLARIFDGQTDSPTSPIGSSSITLIGRQVANYGELQNENFVHMLENFSNGVSPAYPLSGQLWWNNSTNVMGVFDGTAWYPITGFTTSETSPLEPRMGDQWWDETNHQYNVYNGTTWVVVGPAYRALDGKTGAFPEVVYDSGTLSERPIVKLYSSGNLIAIISNASSFTPNVAISGFTNINPGITFNGLIDAVKLYGTATNSDTVGNLSSSQFLRRDVDTTTTSSVTIQQSLYVGANSEFDATVTDGIVSLTNNSIGGNLAIIANVGGILTTAINVDGSDGSVTVKKNPITNLGISTKGYVDTNISQLSVTLTDAISANVLLLNSTINNNYDDLQANIDGTNSSVALKANISNPVFTGIPRAPTPVSNDDSTQIATTEYVVSMASTITDGVTANASALQDSIDAANVAISLKANISSPVFTGIPKSVTPLSGDSSANIATTAFVSSSVSAFDATKIYNGATYVVADSSEIRFTVLGVNIVAIDSSGLTTATQSAGDNSNKVATTEYVDRSMKTYILNSTTYTPTVYVSASAPNNAVGVDGDFWYQYQG